MMTKEDYEVIAKVLADFGPKDYEVGKDRLVMRLCVQFLHVNRQFDPQKFIYACYPNSKEEAWERLSDLRLKEKREEIKARREAEQCP